MSDLDFSHHVSEVPSGENLTKPYHRSEKVQVTPFPDIQSAISNYGEASNWMSSIGSAVASKASDAIAEKIGTELGKNPKGDIGIPLTDFDKTMQNSYKTQSQATLGLQANKLITDANIEAAKATRITPDLIAKTNDSIALGLKNIIKNAPSEVQSKLECQFGNAMLDRKANLSSRMLKEQKEDQRNTNTYASDMNSQHAYTFGFNGNDKAGQDAIENTRKLNEASVASRLISPEDAKTNIDTARKSFLSGKLIHNYEKARAEGKGEEYLKSIADKKPSDISDSDYGAVTQNLIAWVGHQDSLRNQDQQLRIAGFNVAVAQNPMSPDMGSKLQELKNNVSPVAYEKAQLHYIDAVKTYNKENGDTNNALASWNDPSSFARLTDKSINKGFDLLVNRHMQQSQDQGNAITRDEAEVQVAASAGGKVPVFDKELENKLVSGNPASILSGANQIGLLDSMEAGRVYAGISQKAKAIAIQFQAQRGTMPDNDLARKITDNLSNIDGTMQKSLDNSWNLVLSSKGAGGIGASKSLGDFALKEVGINKNDLGGRFFGVVYGNDIYNQLNSNFITARGDYNTALKMTKDYVDQHYGDTFVNGKRQFTDSPIERSLGYKGKDVTPFIQQDVLNQLSVSFEHAKQTHPLDYWETLPLKNGVVEVLRKVQTKDGLKEYRYPVQLVGKANNQWDVVVQTPYAIHNIFLVAPNLGITHYQPNKEAIDKNFKESRHKGWL